LDIVEDQHDFHSYSLRKFVVSGYLDLLRTSDQLLGHKFYVRAAQSAIQTYLAIIDTPPKPVLKGKAKKQQEEDKGTVDKPLGPFFFPIRSWYSSCVVDKPKKKLFGGRQEFDPEGERLMKTTQPLARAQRFVNNLLIHAPNDLHTQLLAAEVYLRQGKLMLSLKAVKKAISLANAQHPAVHLAIVKLFHKSTRKMHCTRPWLLVLTTVQ